MSEPTVLSIVTSGTGASDPIVLPCSGQGETPLYRLILTWAGTPGDTDLEVAHDTDSTFVPYRRADETVVEDITTTYTIVVPPGVYRLNTTTHSSAATLAAKRIQ